ncbi:MAG TPA: hypothetical protein VJ250_05645 [Nitrososphaeraceae archaeon]|nr:hypothetical protein [Nitrososphaeraceae archaeon]
MLRDFYISVAIEEVIKGMVTRLHLNGTKGIVTHKLNLELLKRINDNDYVVPIKASPYSVSTSSDFSLSLLER